MKSKYEMVIGLEIHAQINTKTKLFSTSLSEYAEPNENVNYFDIAMPGTLPLLNENAIRLAVKTGHALHCKIQNRSEFDRKHYFYPDLPLGYQITQFYHPICLGGYIEINEKQIRLNRIHIETDAGKMIHGSNNTYLDYNRVGVPLMEIVTEPDFRSADECLQFLNELILILEYVESCSCNLEKGEFRVDVNISVRKPGEEFGTRCEIKNINSLKFVKEAIEYEFERQTEEIESGNKIIQQTRGYDSDKKITFSMRLKEDADQYRYYRDFNLPILNLEQAQIDKWISEIKALPYLKRKEYSEYLQHETIKALVGDKKLVEYFEKTQKTQLIANLITNEIMAICRKSEMNSYDSNITPENINDIANLLEEKRIERGAMKTLFNSLFEKPGNVMNLVKELDLENITDLEIIKNICKEVIANNAGIVEKYKSGQENVFQVLVGNALKLAKNKVNSIVIQDQLKELLEC